MKRTFAIGGLILLCFILQTTVFTHRILATVTPNLLLILTVSFGFMRGKKEGILVGFFCGFIIDMFYGNFLGFNALLYMYLGYMNGFFCKVFYDDDIKVPMFFVAISDLIYGAAVYVLQFMMRGRLDFVSYLEKIILPEVVYTVLMTLVLYRIFYVINRKLVDSDMRGRNSNWLRR